MTNRFLGWYDGLSSLQSFGVRMLMLVVLIIWHIPWMASVRNGGSTTLFHLLVDFALIIAMLFLMLRYWKYNIHRINKDE